MRTRMKAKAGEIFLCCFRRVPSLEGINHLAASGDTGELVDSLRDAVAFSIRLMVRVAGYTLTSVITRAADVCM